MRNVLTPVRAPNCNAYAERFVLSIKSECLGKMVFFGDNALRRACHEFIPHYNHERNHQGIGNELIGGDMPVGDGRVECSERLGALLKFYRRAAWRSSRSARPRD